MIGSPAGLVAAAVATPLGRMGSERSSGRWLGCPLVGRARIRVRESELAVSVLGLPLDTGDRAAERNLRAFGADDGDARGRHYLLEDVVVVLLSVSGLRVNTHVHSGLDIGDALRRSPSRGRCRGCCRI